MRTLNTDKLGNEFNRAYKKSILKPQAFAKYVRSKRKNVIYINYHPEGDIDMFVNIDGTIYQFYFNVDANRWFCKI